MTLAALWMVPLQIPSGNLRTTASSLGLKRRGCLSWGCCLRSSGSVDDEGNTFSHGIFNLASLSSRDQARSNIDLVIFDRRGTRSSLCFSSSYLRRPLTQSCRVAAQLLWQYYDLEANVLLLPTFPEFQDPCRRDRGGYRRMSLDDDHKKILVPRLLSPYLLDMGQKGLLLDEVFQIW